MKIKIVCLILSLGFLVSCYLDTESTTKKLSAKVSLNEPFPVLLQQGDTLQGYIRFDDDDQFYLFLHSDLYILQEWFLSKDDGLDTNETVYIRWDRYKGSGQGNPYLEPLYTWKSGIPAEQIIRDSLFTNDGQQEIRIFIDSGSVIIDTIEFYMEYVN